MAVRLLSLLLVAGLAACGSNRHCQGEFPYQKAQTLPPPAAVEGLSWPESPSALKIPPAPETTVPYATTVPDGKNPKKSQTECLDTPPRLPAPAPEPAKAETPAKS
jgi:uncharacterized lipoprotein